MTAALRARAPWLALSAAAAALAVVPVVFVAAAALTPDAEVWGHLWRTRLPEMLSTTALLFASVGAGTLVLGLGLAWLVTLYRFPGRRLLRVALVLPLAMPGYVLGFVFMSTFSYAGPVQSTLRSWMGPDVWFPEIRSLLGVTVVLVLALYPYVYLLALTALREQGLRGYQVARTLGHGPVRAVRRGVLPLARPAIAAGAALVAMEVLTDFATVQYFNVDTISVGIFRLWKGIGDRAAATELAVLVLGVALAVVAVERLLRGRARFHRSGPSAAVEPAPLPPARGWLATSVCLAVVGVAFVAPVWRLATWSGFGGLVTAERFVEHLVNSLVIAGLAGLACVVLAVVVTSSGRLGGGGWLGSWATRSTLVGYALPGPVVAIGVLLAFSALARLAPVGGGVVLATGTIFGVLYAYVVRFLPLATLSLDAGFERVHPSMDMAARTLGAPPRRLFWRVHLPLLRPSIGLAGLLVVVHAVKELPIVLLLRPFGFDTLSVWVWRLASASAWEQAGLPALAVVAVALVPVALTVRETAGAFSSRPELATGPVTAAPRPVVTG